MPPITFDELGRKLGLSAHARDDLQARVVHDLLLALHRTSDQPEDVARNQRIEDAYRTLYQQPLPTADQVVPTFALGLPGTGLQATFRAAVQEVARLIGMTVQTNPQPDAELGPNDLAIWVKAVSDDTLDLPRSKSALASRRAQQMQQAGGGLVLLDLDEVAKESTIDQALDENRPHALRDHGVLLGATRVLNPSNDDIALSSDIRAVFHPVLMAPGATRDPAVRTSPLFNQVTDTVINERLMERFKTVETRAPISLKDLAEKLDPKGTNEEDVLRTRRQPSKA